MSAFTDLLDRLSPSEPRYGWSHARQRAQAAARYDREARETIAAYNAWRTAENIAKHVAVARRKIELRGAVILRGYLKGRTLTAEERAVLGEAVKDAWRTLKRHADFVTVLS